MTAAFSGGKLSRLLCAAALAFVLDGCATSAKPPAVEFLNSGKVIPTNLPFSEAVKVGDTLYLSGQIGVVPGTLKLATGGLGPESRQAMNNIKSTLEAHGYNMGDLVKCTVMLADMRRWAEFNDIYKTFFDRRFPARSAFGAHGLALGAQVEVECIAIASRP